MTLLLAVDDAIGAVPGALFRKQVDSYGLSLAGSLASWASYATPWLSMLQAPGCLPYGGATQEEGEVGDGQNPLSIQPDGFP